MNKIALHTDLPVPYGGRLIDLAAPREGRAELARRAGQNRGFTGVDDPYEPPLSPEITLDITNTTAEENTRRIVGFLLEKGFLAG